MTEKEHVDPLDPALCRALSRLIKQAPIGRRLAFLLPLYADGTTGLPVPVPAAVARPDCFELSNLQESILRHLEGKFVRAAKLGDMVGGTRNMYHRPGGIWELRDMGLVALDRRGYYRPDAPPPEMIAEGETEDGSEEEAGGILAGARNGTGRNGYHRHEEDN